MKKFLAFATLASVALVGCVNDEKMEMTSGAQKISFDNPVMSTQTRAVVTGEIVGTAYPETEKFVVYAKQHSGDLNTWAAASSFWNKNNDDPIIVGKENNYWEEVGGKDYYWPKASADNFKLSFAAYSPSGLGSVTPTTVSYDATGLTVNGFTVESTVASQIDFMYSERVLNQQKTESAPVNIQFKHALSSIVFSAIEGDDGATYKIQTVKISGTFAQSGKFEEGVDDGDTYKNTTGYPKWTPAAGTSTTYQPILTADFDVPDDKPSLFTGAGTASTEKSAILAIPQDVPDDATVTITYTRSSTDGDIIYTSGPINLKSFKDASSNTIEKWEIGKRYTYQFQFGGTPKIYFSPSVVDWIPGGTVSVKI